MAKAGQKDIKRGADERTRQHQGDLEAWSIFRIAKVFGLDRVGLIKRIQEAHLEPAKKTKFSTYYFPRDIVSLLMTNRAAVKADAEAKGAEARYKEARATQAELKLKALERQMVPVTEVVRALSDILVAVRRKMLAVPSKVAPRLAKAKTPQLALALLKAEVSLALEDLATAEPAAMISGGTVTVEAEDAE